MTMYAPLRQGDLFPISDFSRTLSSEALPAKTSAAPTPKARASKEKGQGSSSKPFASSENAALVGSLLKTALISELGALTPSSLRWRESATPAGRSWFVLETSEPTTNDRDAGSSGATPHKLSTPRASDMNAGGHGDTGRMGTVRHILATPRKTDADRGFRGDVLSQLHGHASKHAGMLPTPMAMDGMRDGAGGGSGATYPFRQILGTPTSNPAPRGSVLRRVKGAETSVEDAFDRTPNAGEIVHFMLPTPVAQTQQGGMRWEGGAGGRKVLKESGLMDVMQGKAPETLPTPTKRDKRKSPTMDAVMDGALTDRASDKWQYARQIAAILTAHGLSGASMTLPLVYGWMMGFPGGWLERALLSAVQGGRLPLPSSSKRMATPSSRRFRKRSGEQSSE